MSKGGAGKVYFVLYLAVILELLIIFIERDEAEESLRRQQRQALEIVQTILAQLTTGSGATGITATPKDNITINEEKPGENVRNYDVTVAVGDPKVVYEVRGQRIKGDDVAKLEYVVSHIGNSGLLEEELGVDSVDIENGEVIFKAELGTLVNPANPYLQPRQTYGAAVPAENTETYFQLNEVKTNEQLARGRRIKVFSVNFKPNRGEGWYRLRFQSETNKILGVTAEPKSTDTVRIGNIKLAVAQLKQVQKVLKKSGTKDTTTANKVLKYIETLLTPDAYRNLPENKGFTSFNVRVVRPPAQKPQEPYISIEVQGDTIKWLEGAPLSFRVRGGPLDGGVVQVPGYALSKANFAGASPDLYDATLSNPQSTDGNATSIIARAMNKQGKKAETEKFLQVDKIQYKGQDKGFSRWRALRATIGSRYDPSSDWDMIAIRPEHYQTVVTFNGKTVFNRPGYSFKSLGPQETKELTVAESVTKIVTTVYWRPNGTPDPSQWVPLASTSAGDLASPETGPAGGGRTPPPNLVGGGVRISYPGPIQEGGYECVWSIKSPADLTFECPETMKFYSLVSGREYGAQAELVQCNECEALGIRATLTQVDEFLWKIVLTGNLEKIVANQRELIGKRLDFPINLKGKGGADGVGGVAVVVKFGG